MPNKMFSSLHNTPFNQSSSSQSGSSSVFGQTSNLSSDIFTFPPSTPIGIEDPFTSSTGASLFGVYSIGSSGSASSQTSSTSIFGATSCPASGSSSFSSSAFSIGFAFNQSSSSQSGSSSVFGQTSNLSSNIFTFPPSTPIGIEDPFTSSTGASLFGGNSIGSSGSASSQTSSTSIFGATSFPASGSSSFSSSAFSIGSGYCGIPSTTSSDERVSSIKSHFGSGDANSVPSNSLFGVSYAPGSEASGTTSFGLSNTTISGSVKIPPLFGQSTSSSGCSKLPDLFSGALSTATLRSINSGTSAFSGQDGGSRFASYTTTSETDGVKTTQFPSEMVSIGAMPVYKDKSHVQLTSQNYQLGDHGRWRPVKHTNRFVPPTPSFSDLGTEWCSTCTTSQCLNPLEISSTSNNIFSNPAVALSCNTAGVTQPVFGGKLGGTRVACYTTTSEDGTTTDVPSYGKIDSISAMPIYNSKSHEELRLEDYKLGDKGGHRLVDQLSGGLNVLSSTTLGNPFSPLSAPANPPVTQPVFGGELGGTRVACYTTTSEDETKTGVPSYGKIDSISAMPIYNSKSHEELRLEDYKLGDKGGHRPVDQLSGGLNVLSSTTLGNPFSPLSAPANLPVNPVFPSTHSNLFTSQRPTFCTSETQVSGPTLPAVFPNPFSSSSTSPFSQYHTPCRCGSFFKHSDHPNHPNASRVPSTGGGSSQNIFSSIPCSTKMSAGFSQTEAASVASPPTLTADHRDAVSAGASSQLSAGSNDSRTANHTGGQIQKSAPATAAVVRSTVSSPSVVQPQVQISVDSPCCTLSIQCGISSIHLQVPFFCNEEEERISKVDDAFKSKQNPQGWTCYPTKDFPCQGSSGESSTDSVRENSSVRINLKTNGVNYDNHPMPEGCLHITVKRNGDGDVSIDVGHNPDVTAIMPKIQNAHYYTKPPIKELAARERAEPGFCGHVKDFVVGRQGYGSIKFLEETDVRKLDLESLIQFNYKEVIVYEDDSKKPPIGQGLNKPAEITLLNVKCIDKNTGKHYTDGPQVEKYREMLKEKAAELHAEMISYDPVQGEWKFRVQHF